jgi:hypothetical protein
MVCTARIHSALPRPDDARFHEKTSRAGNQAESRLEGTLLQDMAHELAFIRQQVGGQGSAAQRSGGAR